MSTCLPLLSPWLHCPTHRAAPEAGMIPAKYRVARLQRRHHGTHFIEACIALRAYYLHTHTHSEHCGHVGPIREMTATRTLTNNTQSFTNQSSSISCCLVGTPVNEHRIDIIIINSVKLVSLATLLLTRRHAQHYYSATQLSTNAK